MEKKKKNTISSFAGLIKKAEQTENNENLEYFVQNFYIPHRVYNSMLLAQLSNENVWLVWWKCSK